LKYVLGVYMLVAAVSSGNQGCSIVAAEKAEHQLLLHECAKADTTALHLCPPYHATVTADGDDDVWLSVAYETDI